MNESNGINKTSDQVPLAMRLEEIFMPDATRQRRALYTGDSEQAHAQFVHYTSADAALKIISSKHIWMRNVKCMADYREVQHGFDILNAFFSNQPKRRKFSDAIDACFTGVSQEAIDLFNQWFNDLNLSTYITSISEHDKKENLHGRLSMWRAFGGSPVRVAIVLNIPRATESARALNILFSPVAYLTPEQAHDSLDEVVRNVTNNSEFLSSLERPVIVNYIFHAFITSVICLKHEGFREEREWRAIYSPNRESSALMKSSTEVVWGVPQKIYKIPLDGTVSEAIKDLDLARLFDRLIIGPSPYPWPMYEAFALALKDAGVADVEKRVFVSGIPIRV